jgi:PEP-CTERM motif
MSKARVVTGILSAVFCLTFVSSAFADRSHLVEMSLEKEIYAQNHKLIAFDDQRVETGYLYAGHFENNNGKHLGFARSPVFSVASRGIERLPGGKKSPPSVSENPEPTAMVLLGTGLAAAGAIARRKNRKRAK